MFPAFPAHAQPAILRVWEATHLVTEHLHVYGLVQNNSNSNALAIALT